MLVFARKPAPVQATYLNYCSTTGLQTIDYRFSDSSFDPDDSDQPYYSEKTLRLRSYWCYPAPMEAPEVGPVPSSITSGGLVTFGCLNEFVKLNPTTFSMWSRVLGAVPNSRLLLLAPQPDDRRIAHAAFAANGIDPARIECVGVVPLNDYFATYQRIDIALDPTPWCGGTTTCDSLWMGVPVVTLAGRTAISRGGLSILSQIGLRELVAREADGYVATAVSLARDTSRRQTLRATLRDCMRRSPLMDAVGFARDFESLLRRMWRERCQAFQASLG